MKTTNSYLLFRMLVPFLISIFIYLLMLLIFNNVNQLSENFFSSEYLFILLISYFLSEVFMLTVKFSSLRFRLSKKLFSKFTFQLIVNFALCALIVTGSVLLYFKLVIGYSINIYESINFIIAFSLYYFIYNGSIISIQYFDFYNNILLQSAKKQRTDFELQINNFKDKSLIYFLEEAMEILLNTIYEDKKLAEKIVNELSMFYRYILKNTNNELVEVMEELECAKKMIFIYNLKYSDKLILDINLEAQDGYYIIPLTIIKIIHNYIHCNLLSNNTKNKILVKETKNEYIEIRLRDFPKFNVEEKQKNMIQSIENIYKIYSDIPFKVDFVEDMKILSIPKLKIETHESTNN